MEDENCAQFFCPAGLLRSVPAPAAGWRAPLPARARSASPAAMPAAVWVCVPGRSEHLQGSGGGERRPSPRPHPSRGQTSQTASPPGSRLGAPGVGRRAAHSPTLTPHVRDRVGI